MRSRTSEAGTTWVTLWAHLPFSEVRALARGGSSVVGPSVNGRPAPQSPIYLAAPRVTPTQHSTRRSPAGCAVCRSRVISNFRPSRSQRVAIMQALAEVVFMSQERVEAYLPRPYEAIISITDHGASNADLNAGWHAVLRLSFDDVDPIDSPAEPDEVVIELQDDQADQIAAFVRDNFHSVNTLVVHCKYGQSRSAGVAKAIAKQHGLAFPDLISDESQPVPRRRTC
jgi:predicted protein tyrosine phosphatase